MIIYGTNTYGAVDKVDDLFCIKTNFIHIWFVPLIPIGSHLIFEESMSGFTGVPVGFNGKSVLTTYARTFCFLGAVVSAATLFGGQAFLIAGGVIGLCIFLALLIGSYLFRGWTHASYQRALHLVRHYGLGPQAEAMIHRKFKGQGSDVVPAAFDSPNVPNDYGDPHGYGQQQSDSWQTDLYAGDDADLDTLDLESHDLGGAPGRQTQPGVVPAAGYAPQGMASQPANPYGGAQAAPYGAPAHTPYGAPPAAGDSGSGKRILFAVLGGVGVLVVLPCILFLLVRGLSGEPENPPLADNNNGPGFEREVDRPGQFNPPRAPRPGRREDPPFIVAELEPKTIDEALTQLRSGDDDRLLAACRYLRREENVDVRRRAEVCLALSLKAQGQPRVHREQIRALQPWMGKEAIPGLAVVLDELGTSDSGLRSEIVRLLTSIQDVATAPLLASSIDDFQARRGLEQLGPTVSNHVLPFLNSPEHSNRHAARELLKTWGIDEEVLLKQSIKDLDSADGKTVANAVEFISDSSGDVDGAPGLQLAATIERILVNPEIEIREKTVKMLGRFARDPETPRAILQALNVRPKSYQVDEAMIEILGRFDSEAAIEGLVFAWSNDRGRRSDTEKLFKSIESPLLAGKLAGMLETVDPGRRPRIMSMLQTMESAAPVLINQCCIDLKSGDSGVIEDAAELLAKMEEDPAAKPQVAEALLVALDDVVLSDDDSMIRDVLEAAGIWGDGEVGLRLVSLLKAGTTSNHTVVNALGELNEPSTYPELARLLIQGEGGGNMYRMFEDFGIASEAAILSELKNLDPTDTRVTMSVFQVIGKVGGNESIKTMEKIAANTNDPMISTFAESAVRKLKQKPESERVAPEVVVAVAQPDGPIEREWLDATGENKIVGKLLGVSEGKADLEVNGTMFNTPLTLLSQADRDYIAAEMEKRRAAENP